MKQLFYSEGTHVSADLISFLCDINMSGLHQNLAQPVMVGVNPSTTLFSCFMSLSYVKPSQRVLSRSQRGWTQNADRHGELEQIKIIKQKQKADTVAELTINFEDATTITAERTDKNVVTRGWVNTQGGVIMGSTCAGG